MKKVYNITKGIKLVLSENTRDLVIDCNNQQELYYYAYKAILSAIKLIYYDMIKLNNQFYLIQRKNETLYLISNHNTYCFKNYAEIYNYRFSPIQYIALQIIINTLIEK